MKIKKSTIRKMVKESLLNEIPEDIYSDPIASARQADDIVKSKQSDQLKSISKTITWHMQKGLSNFVAGFPDEIAFDKKEPLALRGFSRWWSQSPKSKEDFTEADLTDPELKTLKMILMSFCIERKDNSTFKKKLVSGDNNAFAYRDYANFPLLSRKEGTANPVWFQSNNKSENFYKGDSKSYALNFSKFLGQFNLKLTIDVDTNKKSASSTDQRKYPLIDAVVTDRYDFNEPTPGKITQPDVLTIINSKDEKYKAPAIALFNFMFNYYWEDKSLYSSLRKASGAAQKHGITPYNIKIKIKDIFSEVEKYKELGKSK
jgi:hypothetical protein